MSALLELHIGTDTVLASMGQGSAAQRFEAVGYSSDAELQDAIRQVVARSDNLRRSKGVRVLVDAALLQQRILTDLPPVSTKALQALVARGTSRFFRQNGHALLSGAVWSGQDDERRATAVAIDGVVAAAIVAAVEDTGLQVEDIVPGDGPRGISLLPATERTLRHQRAWRSISRMALATLGLWLVVLAVLGLRRWQEGRSIEQNLSRLREPRVALIAARRALAEASAMATVMDQAATQRQLVARWVLTIGDALPDSAYIDELTIDATGTGTLKGKARDPMEVHARLQQAGGVRIADFTVTSSGEAAWQAFAVTLGRGKSP